MSVRQLVLMMVVVLFMMMVVQLFMMVGVVLIMVMVVVVLRRSEAGGVGEGVHRVDEGLGLGRGGREVDRHREGGEGRRGNGLGGAGAGGLLGGSRCGSVFVSVLDLAAGLGHLLQVLHHRLGLLLSSLLLGGLHLLFLWLLLCYDCLARELDESLRREASVRFPLRRARKTRSTHALAGSSSTAPVAI
jgi:hypothetical protein